jgi:hypothetical protein
MPHDKSRRRNKTNKINYVEVDSDVDMPSDEERKEGDETVGRGKKRKRASKGSEEDDYEVGDTTKATGEFISGL